MAQKRRIYQIAEKIRTTIASQLFHVADPRFSLVTITSVVASPDLRHAKVYWVATGGKERQGEIAQAFESASGLLKRYVGEALGIRFSPDLRFYYDDTLDTVDEVERLFAKIKRPSSEGEE